VHAISLPHLFVRFRFTHISLNDETRQSAHHHVGDSFWLLDRLKDVDILGASADLWGSMTKHARHEPSRGETAELQSSLTLLELARAGDHAALEALITRYLPRLQRWASGRLPRWARDLAETQDLVQEALFQTFTKIERFEPRGEGALQAYLRQAILNRIRDELRRAKRGLTPRELDSQLPDERRSPLEEVIGQEALERYERAIATLRREDRELVVAKIELGYSSDEIAELFGKPTANAARMAVERAIVRLAKEMRHAKT
jgi:RNA polymerase sigma factor (sigma-70 family)